MDVTFMERKDHLLQAGIRSQIWDFSEDRGLNERSWEKNVRGSLVSGVRDRRKLIPQRKPNVNHRSSAEEMQGHAEHYRKFQLKSLLTLHLFENHSPLKDSEMLSCVLVVRLSTYWFLLGD